MANIHMANIAAKHANFFAKTGSNWLFMRTMLKLFKLISKEAVSCSKRIRKRIHHTAASLLCRVRASKKNVPARNFNMIFRTAQSEARQDPRKHIFTAKISRWCLKKLSKQRTAAEAKTQKRGLRCFWPWRRCCLLW